MSYMIANAKPSAANKADVKKTLKLQPNWFMLNETAIGKHAVATVKELRALFPKDQKSRKAPAR